jgi:hypothetical protein
MMGNMMRSNQFEHYLKKEEYIEKNILHSYCYYWSDIGFIHLGPDIFRGSAIGKVATPCRYIENKK